MDPTSIRNFLTVGVLSIVIVIGAIVAATRWKSGSIRDAAAILGVTAIACLIVAVATHTQEVGDWLWKLVSGK